MNILLGEKLRFIREIRELSLKDLARSSGLSISYINALELGRKSNITLSSLNKLARSLGLHNIDYFTHPDLIPDFLEEKDREKLRDALNSVQELHRILGPEYNNVITMLEREEREQLLGLLNEFTESYDLKSGLILTLVRLWQEKHKNKRFEEYQWIEKKAIECAEEMELTIPDSALERKALEAFIEERNKKLLNLAKRLELSFEQKIEFVQPLDSQFRSIRDGNTVYINKKIKKPVQLAFIYAREIAHKILNHKDASTEWRSTYVASMEQRIQDIRANIFAGFLLIGGKLEEFKRAIVENLFFTETPDLNPILNRWGLLPEYVFQKITELNFGEINPHFLRIDSCNYQIDVKEGKLTAKLIDYLEKPENCIVINKLDKLYRASGIPLPPGYWRRNNLCGRWLAIDVLSRYTGEKEIGDVERQISELNGTKSKYVCISVVYRRTVHPKSVKSITIGFNEDDFKKLAEESKRDAQSILHNTPSKVIGIRCDDCELRGKSEEEGGCNISSIENITIEINEPTYQEIESAKNDFLDKIKKNG